MNIVQNGITYELKKREIKSLERKKALDFELPVSVARAHKTRTKEHHTYHSAIKWIKMDDHGPSIQNCSLIY